MSRSMPPGWIMRMFRWFCREELCDAVEGDLLTVYARRVADKGRVKSNIWYFFSVLSFLQPFALKSSRISQRLTAIDMLNNYLKIAYRNLAASKAFTLINVLGLAIGIAGFVVMSVYVQAELSYDRFHTKADRIVRLAYEYQAGAEVTKVSMTAFPMKPMLLEEYPGVEKVVRFFRNSQNASTLRYEDEHFTEDNILFADPEVFQVFDFELEQGDPLTALTDINSIVMTASVAQKYFGDEDPMGKIIVYKNDDRLKVTGILKEVPETSHIQFDMLAPMELQRQRWIRGSGNNDYDFEQDWQWSGAWQYVLLKNPQLIAPFEQKLREEGKAYFGRETNLEYRYQAQALTSIHLFSDLNGEIEVNGNMNQVLGFAAIALLILLIAGINFINLSTARSARRAKEVGLRKVMGAHRPQLIGQFIAESVLIAFLATALSIVLVELMLPYFNQFMSKDLSVPYFSSPFVIPAFLAGGLLIGFLAGCYPAFYISRYKPVKTLKGNTTTDGNGSARLRKVLVTSQFVISNLLIIGILVVQQQLNYIKNKDLGFDKDQVIVLTHGNKLEEEFDLLSSELEKVSAVVTTNRGYVPGSRDWTQSFKVNGESLEEGKSLGIKHVSFDFLKMFDMEVVVGRNFKRGHWADWRKSIMLNESAVKNFGWTNEEALGKIFSYVGGSDNRTLFECKVIGIVADAHLESLYRPIRPSVFRQASWGDVSIKLNTGSPEQLRATLGEIENVWNEISPNWPFEFDFLEDTIAQQYIKEERMSQTIQYFTFLAIFIASLGLFGLASYTVQQRTREIGVRKILGASIGAILVLVSKRFLGLIAVSFLISIPTGYYLATQWLQDFEYRTLIGPGVFIVAGLASVLIASLAVGGQSIRAASINPVKTLRHE